MVEIKFGVRKIFTLMLTIITLLVIFNLIFFWMETIGIGSFRFNSLFYLNEESNIPTYFSGLNLLFASIITFILSLSNDLKIKTASIFWRLLSFIFLFLSFDEVAMFHERIYRITLLFAEFFNTPLVWFIPYSLLVVVVIIILWKNFILLGLKTKLYMGVSAFIFVTGAIGLEHISNNCESIFKIKCSKYLLFGLSSLEETFEMFSICLFNYTALKLFNGNYDYISLEIKRKRNEK